MATLQVPDCVPTPEEDARLLKKAFVGLGTDEATVIRILAHRNGAQRNAIREAYNATFGDDLIKDLAKELSGDFLRAVTLFTMDPAERDAHLANDVTKMFSASNFVIMEIGCARSSYHLFRVRQVYHARYKKSLEEDVGHHTSGDFRKLLVPLVSSFRYEGEEVNMVLAKSEAKLLHEKISAQAFADEEVIRILATRSKNQLNATLNQYNDIVGNPINKDLKVDPNDKYLAFLRATIKCLTYPERYYAKSIRLAINGIGTDEGTLTRVVVTQAEVNMMRIKEEYQKRDSVTLESAISGDTSGDYGKFLLALVDADA